MKTYMFGPEEENFIGRSSYMGENKDLKWKKAL